MNCSVLLVSRLPLVNDSFKREALKSTSKLFAATHVRHLWVGHIGSDLGPRAADRMGLEGSRTVLIRLCFLARAPTQVSRNFASYERFLTPHRRRLWGLHWYNTLQYVAWREFDYCSYVSNLFLQTVSLEVWMGSYKGWKIWEELLVWLEVSVWLESVKIDWHNGSPVLVCHILWCWGSEYQSRRK